MDSGEATADVRPAFEALRAQIGGLGVVVDRFAQRAETDRAAIAAALERLRGEQVAQQVLLVEVLARQHAEMMSQLALARSEIRALGVRVERAELAAGLERQAGA